MSLAPSEANSTFFERLLSPRLRWTIVGCVAMSMLHFGLGLSATRGKCTTFDEVLHITSGYSYNRFGDFRMQPENGNLPQRCVAIPLLLSKPTFPTFDTGNWKTGATDAIGYRFFYLQNNDPDRILFAGRAANGCWSVAIGLLIFVWMALNFGAKPAWLAFLLFCFNPTFLAHGFLATSDAAAAFFFLLTTLLLWRSFQRLNWLSLIGTSLACGGLFVSKFSAPIIIPIGLALGVARLCSKSPWTISLRGNFDARTFIHRFTVLACLAVFFAGTTWLLIWGAYNFRYSAFNAEVCGIGEWDDPWDKVLKKGGVATKAIGWMKDYRLFPEAYLYGALYVQQHSQARRAFLLGELKSTGWWHFFPYCFYAKTPTGILLLLGIAASAVFVRWRRLNANERVAELYRQLYPTAPLWTLWIVYWLFALTSHLNIGHRHLLPVEAPMLMFAGTAAFASRRHGKVPEPIAKVNPTITKSLILVRFAKNIKLQPLAIAVVACVTMTVVGSLSIRPHYLAYFNFLGGGPNQAWKKLVDSSLDWGQDLIAVGEWIDRERSRRSEEQPVYLSYFGTGDPEYYKIHATLLPCVHDRRPNEIPEPLQPGIYCISATMIHGVYSPCPGEWKDEHESVYRECLEKIGNFRYEVRQRGLDVIWPSVPDDEKANWLDLFKKYEELRLSRLTKILKRRNPDTLINYSILVYRVGVAELYEAVEAPWNFTDSN